MLGVLVQLVASVSVRHDGAVIHPALQHNWTCTGAQHRRQPKQQQQQPCGFI